MDPQRRVDLGRFGDQRTGLLRRHALGDAVERSLTGGLLGPRSAIVHPLLADDVDARGMNPAVFEGHERCHDPDSVVALVKRDHALQPGRTLDGRISVELDEQVARSHLGPGIE